MTESFARSLLLLVLLACVAAIAWTHIQKRFEAGCSQRITPVSDSFIGETGTWTPGDDKTSLAERPIRNPASNSLELFVRQIELEKALLNEADSQKKAIIVAQIQSITNSRILLYQGTEE